MNIIRTIDLWTEQNPNHIECFSGAFVDGFENGNMPFNSYKIVRNCNCIITSNQDNLNISNKHNSIIFYKDNVPVRLMVINKETNIDKCINEALSQSFNNSTLREIYTFHSITATDINLNEQAIHNSSDKSKEIDVGSCDRPSLLECMLEGSYTQSDTDYGKSNSDNSYSFIPNLSIEYKFPFSFFMSPILLVKNKVIISLLINYIYHLYDIIFRYPLTTSNVILLQN